jgi:hypothetical protein
MAQCAAQSNNMKDFNRYLKRALRTTETYEFKLEHCHILKMLGEEDAKNDNCYRPLGVKLKFQGIPFNIP